MPPANPTRPALLAYWLGPVELADLEALQHRLVYEVSGGGTPGVVLCEHPAGVSVGRDGSARHVRLTPHELHARRWAVRWVARGGGVLLHAPGQVTCYPIVPLAGRTPAEYVATLCDIGRDLVAGFGLAPVVDAAVPGVRVGGRRLVSVGAAVRASVGAFGLAVNVAPDLELFRDIDCDGDTRPMTSLQRECPTPVRPQAVRQRLTELVADRFGFGRLSIVHQHPTYFPRPTRHATAAAARHDA